MISRNSYLPSWQTSLVEAVKTRLIKIQQKFEAFRVERHSDLGETYISIKPLALLLVDTADDDSSISAVEFSLDIMGLFDIFDAIKSCKYFSYDSTKEGGIGELIELRGVYYGQAVTLRIYANPDLQEEPDAVHFVGTDKTLAYDESTHGKYLDAAFGVDDFDDEDDEDDIDLDEVDEFFTGYDENEPISEDYPDLGYDDDIDD